MSSGKDKTSCEKKVEYLCDDPIEKAKADKALEEIGRDGKVKYKVFQTERYCTLYAVTKEDVDKAAEKYFELRNYGGTQNETEIQHTKENTSKETINHQSTTNDGKTVGKSDKNPMDQSLTTTDGKGSHLGKKEKGLGQKDEKIDIQKEVDSEKNISLVDESEKSATETKPEKPENVDDISDNVSSDKGKSTNADDVKYDNHGSKANKEKEKDIQVTERDAKVDEGNNPENQHKDKVASGKENDTNLSSNPAAKSEKTSTGVVEIISPHGFKIKLYQENLLETDVDAIVNAANETLSHGAGIAKIIAENAGPKMNKECQDYIKKKGHLHVTDTLTTGPGNLKFKKIIHAVGPNWTDYSKKEDCLSDLAETITNVLEEAKRCKLKTVAMPTISSGIFRVPKYMCAAMYLKGVFTFSEQKKFGSLKELHIVDLTSEVLDLVEEKYQAYLSKENTLDPKRLLAIYDEEENIKLEKGSSNGAQTQKVPQTNTNEKNTDKMQNSSNTGTFMKGAQSKCFTKTIKNVRIHIYTHDIRCLQDIDIAVSSENPYFTGSGGIAATLLSTGGKEYAKEHDKLRRSAPFPRYSTKITPGYKTNFKEICHAVVVAFSRNNPLTKDYYNQYTWFIRDILNELNMITENSVRFKHKKGFCSIVLPLLGAGKLQDPNSIQTLCSLMVEGIESYACYQRKHINHIHLVNMREEFTKMLIAACSKTNPERLVYKVNEANVKSIRFDSRPFEFLYSWKIPPVKEEVDIKDFINPADGQRDGVCIICLDDLSKPVELMRCHHCFCRECISGFFSEKPACPVCNTVYGKVYGFQPLNGEANIFKDKRSLPGYPKTGTLIISYEFPNGKQEECHPEPGKTYIGIQRQAYLPNTDEGKEVLHLLEQAFKQRLVFTIGLSRTTGKDGVVTWNDIHHKTSREGGPERFGYPDLDYLNRVKEELKAKGITQA